LVVKRAKKKVESGFHEQTTSKKVGSIGRRNTKKKGKKDSTRMRRTWQTEKGKRY